MTINMGPLKEELKDKLGEKVKLTVHSFAEDEKVKAFGVTGFSTKNKIPHITFSVNRKAGGKPFLSNKLTNWEPVKNFDIFGTVKEIEQK